MLWGCIKCGQKIPQYSELCTECEEKQFRKIGGLLYLPLIGLIVSALFHLFALATMFKMITVNYWHVDTGPKIFFSSSLLIYVMMFLLTIFTLSLFLKKKKSLPKMYVLFLVSIVVTMSINVFLLYKLIPGVTIGHDELVPVFRNIISALIWIPYFMTSVRVKRTFIK